jgi:hypothetical protein
MILVVLELALPLDGELPVDLVSGAALESTLVVTAQGESYAVYAVPGTPEDGSQPTDRGDLLFVAEPSDQYAHVYTVFSDASAAGAASRGADGSPTAGPASSAGTPSFPVAIDVSEAVTSLTGSGPSSANTVGLSLWQRGEVTYLAEDGGELLLVIHGRLRAGP